MNDVEWLNCADPKPMLNFLMETASDRKMRLFASNCCGRVRQHFSGQSDDIDPAVLASERAADGLMNAKELRDFERQIGALGAYSAAAYAAAVRSAAVNQEASVAAKSTSECAVKYFSLAALETIGEEEAKRRAFVFAGQLEQLIEAAILREIFGNPFRPIQISSEWLTPEVIEQARSAYERPHSHLFLLAEALTKAGCNDEDILDHCQQVGGHVKGCWVVDLMLGKN